MNFSIKKIHLMPKISILWWHFISIAFWTHKSVWLVYSNFHKTAYCLFCLLFFTYDISQSAFSTQGAFFKWGKKKQLKGYVFVLLENKLSIEFVSWVTQMRVWKNKSSQKGINGIKKRWNKYSELLGWLYTIFKSNLHVKVTKISSLENIHISSCASLTWKKNFH